VTDQAVRTARELVRPLLRVRQIRQFTAEPPTDAELAAIADAGRWSGSSNNEQPWRFIVIRDPKAIATLHRAGLPQTGLLATAPAAIAIALPEDEWGIARAYDDGRAAERMLIAAHLLGLGAGIGWIRRDVASVVAAVLGLPPRQFVRTILAVGHPTASALAPKSASGQARRPREQSVFEERWPRG
jgi:nitroreductase